MPSRQTKSNETHLSLRNRITIHDLGTRVERSAPFEPPAPAKKPNRSVDKIFAFVQRYLNDISHPVLESACDILIKTLKDETLTAAESRKEVEAVLGPQTSEQLNELTNLVQSMRDDSSDSSDSDDTAAESESEDSDPESQSDSDAPAELPEWCTNAHYLKNLIAPTPVKPAQVLQVLRNEGDDLEKNLVQLFNYEFLDIIETLMAHRLKIYWYTTLLNAETGIEREQALEAIKSKGLEPSTEGAYMESIDLDSLVPSISHRFSASSKLSLPEGSEKSVHGSYEQYVVPFLEQQTPVDEELVAIESMPEWIRPVFKGITTLNRVQSRVYDAAFKSSGNMLLCAPTGAGKTNAALLAILQCIQEYKTTTIDLTQFKIVYISPLKALVQEQVRTFSLRLEPLGITVAELSGDNNLTSDQIAATQLIITTPEKWDIVTRKSNDVAYTSLVRLVIIDEIHLLHDPRGPALENIVARSHIIAPDTRLVGLSATLPNYKDVATFLNAPHCFYFDASYRPCPLKQIFVGITEKSAFKRHNALNEICYEKVIDYVHDHQTIVFVHSRKDTAKTARFLIEKAADEYFTYKKFDNALVDDQNLKDLLPHGIGIHHAGLSRKDRSLVEQLFADRKLKVLVSTATLAWGINLPAHAVIIKGTQVYSPQDGQWEELSPQDVLQMLGRAGRPGFDSFGEGIIITLHDQLAYYMSVLTSQFPIESQLITRLADSLNAEVCLGTVKSLDDGVQWLGKTYYFVRMKSDPKQYRAGIDYDDDGQFEHRRKVVIHSALKYLNQSGMVKYSGGKSVEPTEIGKIAAKFYISPASMAVYMKQLKPYFGSLEIIRVFARSKEFENIPLRREEKAEVERLGNLVPIPIKDKIDEPFAKTSILLQAYVARLGLVGLALSSDMVYITQSASRLLRAMFELALAKRWASLALNLHDMFLSVDKRMWLTSSPFRQFYTCPADIIRKTENSPMPWNRYFDLKSPEDVARVLRIDTHAATVYELLRKFPRLNISVLHQTLTPTLLRLSVEITPAFIWDRTLHNRSQSFLLLVSDGDNETILHYEWLLITEKDASSPVAIQFTVPIVDPMTPAYFVTVISDSWLHSKTVEPVNLESLIIPEKFTAPTAVKYVDPLDISHIEFPFSATALNMMQSQAFDLLHGSDRNAFIGMNESCGTSLQVELVFARHYGEPGIIVYMHADEKKAHEVYKKYAHLDVGELDGNLQHDLMVLSNHKIVVSSVKNMDRLTRTWQKYKQVQAINVVITDAAHLIGSSNGYVLERTIIRLKFMAVQLELQVRFVEFSHPVAGSELGKWFGASKSCILNFTPKDCPSPPSTSVEAFDQRDFISRQQMMIQRTLQIAENGKTACFVASRESFADILRQVSAREIKLQGFEVECADKLLQQSAKLGIPYIYKGMDPKDLQIILALDAPLLFATTAMVAVVPTYPQVVVLNTQFSDYKEGIYSDYTAVQVIDMSSKALNSVYVLTTCGKAAYYEQFLKDPLPVESHLMYYLTDTLMIEVAEQVVDSPENAMDLLTYSYFFHRLRANPSYYGLSSTEDDTINEYLSELIEGSIEDLSNENIIEAADDEDMTLTPLDGAFIGSINGLSVATITLFNTLDASSNLEQILRCVSQAAEFAFVDVDSKEYATLLRLQQHLPFAAHDGTPIQVKIFILLQAHLSRRVPVHSSGDLEPVANTALTCVIAIADILSGKGALNALIALDLHQMIMQGVWDKDSPLKQIPTVGTDTVERCNVHGIYSVGDFLEIEDPETRNTVLGFDETDPRMVSVADFCNEFPSIDIQSIEPVEYSSDDVGSLEVTIEREIDDEEQDEGPITVQTRYKFLERPEQWYMIVGSTATRELYGAKKVSLNMREQTFQIPITVTTIGKHELNVWCVCAGYLDADKEATAQVTVV